MWKDSVDLVRWDRHTAYCNKLCVLITSVTSYHVTLFLCNRVYLHRCYYSFRCVNYSWIARVIMLKGKVGNKTSHSLSCIQCLNVLLRGNWVFFIRNSPVKDSQSPLLPWVKISRCVFVYFHVLIAEGN